MSDKATREPESHDEPPVYLDPEINCWVFRASATNNCIKELVLTRMGIQGAPPPEDMQRRYDDGHLHEASIVKAIGEQRPGWTIHEVDPDTDRQYVVEIMVREPDGNLPGLILRGHTDGLAINRLFNPDSRILEAKAFSKDNYENAIRILGEKPTPESVKRFFAAYPYYAKQATVYMAAAGVPMTWGIKNKNSGKTFVFDVDEHPDDLDEIKAKVILVDQLASAGTIPDQMCTLQWPCSMYRFHPPKGSEPAKDKPAADGFSWDDLDGPNAGGPPLPGEMDEESEAEFLRLCEEYNIGREMEKEGKARKDEAKRKLREGWLPKDDSKVKHGGFTAFMKRNTRRWLNEDQMVEDGIEVEKYREQSVTYYAQVTRKKG